MLLRKKRTLWSSPTSALYQLIATGLTVGMTLSPQAVADDSCARDPNHMTVVVQLTNSGQQKALQVAYEATRRNMDNLLKFVPEDFPEFGADPKKCKRENIMNLSPEVMKSDCMAFVPDGVWDGTIPGASLERPVALSMKMGNVKIKHLALGKNPEIKCKNNVCDVTTTIDAADVSLDFALKSVDESCNKYALKNIKLSLNSKALAKKPSKVHLRYRYTGDTTQPVEVLWDNSQISLPSEAVKFSAEKAAPGQNICKDTQDIQDVVPTLVNHFVAKNQFIINTIIDNVRNSSSVRQVADVQIKELARQNGLGNDKYVSAVIPSIKQISTDVNVKGATQDRVNQADDYLTSIMRARGASEINSAASAHSFALNLSDYLDSFKSSRTPTTVDMVQALSNKWKDTAKELTRLAANSDSPTRAVIKRETAKINALVSKLDQFQDQVKVELDSNRQAEEFAVTVAAMKLDDPKSQIQAKIDACYRCQMFAVPTVAKADWGFDEGKYDIAVKTDYGTLNQALAIMQKSHGLDTCVIKGAQRDCKDTRADDEKIDIHFSEAPEIFWDTRSNSFAVRVKKIQLIPQNGDLAKLSRKIETDVVLPGKISIDSETKMIHFEPIADTTDITHPNLAAAQWGDRWHIISGAFAWAVEKALNTSWGQNMARDQIKTALTVNLPMPEAATLTQVKATPQGFAVYFNLPENPLDLLSPETPARALAGKRTTLK